MVAIARQENAADQRINFRWMPPAISVELAQKHDALYVAMFRGYNTDSYTDYLWKLQSGMYRVLVVENMAALLSFGESNGKKLCNIITMTGDLSSTDMDRLIPLFHDILRQNGCQVILSVGRKGYAKTIAKHGYKISPCILMRCEL